MESYIDIHSHILPQIDDGAKSFEISLQMLDAAAKSGIGQIILTPHNKPMRHSASPGRVKALKEELEREAQSRGIHVRLYTGNEVYYRSSAAEELAEGKACTLAGSKYVLTEFNPMDDYDYIRNGIYSLLAAGYRPVLAHVERYSQICAKPQRAEELAELGSCLQVNAGSIMGEAGFRARRIAGKLLKQRLVHFVATDAHDMGRRKPGLAACASYVARRFGAGYMRELFYENPMCVVRDGQI